MKIKDNCALACDSQGKRFILCIDRVVYINFLSRVYKGEQAERAYAFLVWLLFFI